jgi:nucleoid DNA-binding protein
MELTKHATIDATHATLEGLGRKLTKVQIEECLEAYFEVVIASTKQGNKTYSPIGKFKPKKLKERSGTAMGKEYSTPARTTLKIDPSKKYQNLDK